MHGLTAIVAMNEDRVIGARNALPWRVRSDMQFFKKTTTGNVIVMGRKTYDSVGGCLPNRVNIVVTHGFNMLATGENCLSAGSIVEALATAAAKCGRKQEVFIIGGASMYEQFAPYIDRYLVTEISKPVPDADSWFDSSVFGDTTQWSWKLVGSGLANDQGDEADYKIYEAKSTKASEIARIRTAAISQFFARSPNKSARKFVSSTVEAFA